MNATKPPGVATATPIATDAAQAAVSPALTPAAVRDGVAMALLEASPDCVKLIEPDGTVRFLNRAGYSLMEIDAGSAIQGQALVGTVAQ